MADASRNGLASRQGFASQRLALRAAEKMRMMNGPFWDACCGREEKAVPCASAALLRCCVPIPRTGRLAFLRTDVERLGLDRLEIVAGEAQSIAAAHPQAFNGILLDAPCSGTGTLARNPELRLRLTPQKLEAAARLQRELLDAVWPALRPAACWHMPHAP